MNQDLINAAVKAEYDRALQSARAQGANEVINQLEDRLGIKFDKTALEIADELRKG